MKKRLCIDCFRPWHRDEQVSPGRRCSRLLWIDVSAFPLALGLALSLGLAATIAAGPGCKSAPEERRGAALDDLHSFLREAVTDPVRSRDALALLDAIEHLTSEVERLRSAFEVDMATLNRDHATEDASLVARFAAFRQQRDPLRAQAIAKREEMRALLTAEEWSGYAKRELSLVLASRAQGGAR